MIVTSRYSDGIADQFTGLPATAATAVKGIARRGARRPERAGARGVQIAQAASQAFVSSSGRPTLSFMP